MIKSTSNNLLHWTFVLFSVIIAWQLNFPQLIKTISNTFGFTENGLCQNILIDIGVPSLITIFATISLIIYRYVIWPFIPGSQYQGGWWIYALFSEKLAKGRRQVKAVGCFKVLHTLQESKINEGRVYYVKEDNSFERVRYWFADTVWISNDIMRFIFSMRAVDPSPEILPSHYDGYFEISLITKNPLIGKTVWSGYFNDLKDRRDVFGTVYAERISKLIPKKIKDIDKYLNEHVNQLLERASS